MAHRRESELVLPEAEVLHVVIYVVLSIYEMVEDWLAWVNQE